MPLELTPGSTDLGTLARIWRETESVVLTARTHPAIKASAKLVAKSAQGEVTIYGINTGFGKFASVKIPPKDTAQLQRNLVFSHCCGVGERLEPATTRLMMALKLLSLGRGAAGDLAPLAHMAAVMIGAGEAEFDSQTLGGGEALENAGLTPIELQAKAGLALLNGTQFSTACALASLFDIWHLVEACLVTSSLSTDAIMGSTAPLCSKIHILHGHQCQIDVAEAMSKLLDGSAIRESHRDCDTRVQNPYCIRCQPQVTGTAVGLIPFASRAVEIESNTVTYNPLVLTETGGIVSGGNFHAEPVTFAADQIAMAISEIGAIAQHRIALMVDPTLSFDLPAFLSLKLELNSGFMIPEVTTAALMSENKHLAHPCSIDSMPTPANHEEHVSMAAHGVRRLKRMNGNLTVILAVKSMCAVQGFEERAPLCTSEALQKAAERFRVDIARLKDDRYMADDIKAATRLIATGALATDSGVILAL